MSHVIAFAVASGLAELLTDASCALERVEFDESKLSIDNLQLLASAFERNRSVRRLLFSIFEADRCCSVRFGTAQRRLLTWHSF